MVGWFNVRTEFRQNRSFCLKFELGGTQQAWYSQVPFKENYANNDNNNNRTCTDLASMDNYSRLPL